MKPEASLPRPRLTIRIGVVGHRLNKLAPERIKVIREKLRGDLALVEASLLRVGAQPSCRAYSDLPPEIRLVSALAEGTDRIAVQCAPAGWDVTALLPMPVKEYERDFVPDGESDTPSVAEFRDLLGKASRVTELPMLDDGSALGQPDRAEQYGALGAFLVRQVDLLVAVWDGRAAAGPGGTALVIADAVRRGVAVIWLDPTTDGETRLLSGFTQADILQPETKPLSEQALDDAMLEIVGFDPQGPAGPEPAVGVGPHGGTDPHGGASQHEDACPHGPANDLAPKPGEVPAYARERWPRAMWWAIAYPALRKLSGGGGSWPSSARREAEALKDWDRFLAHAGEGPGSGSELHLGDLRGILLPRFVWADALSSRHSQLYRSAYVTIFMLAGLSVSLGLLYLFLQDSEAVLDIKAGFVAAEIVVILTVVGMVRVGRRRDWHASWIETRELSELLRLARPLALVGALADLVDATRASGGSRESFPIWYTRATVRNMRPLDGRLDDPYLRGVLTAVLKDDIDGQIGWHTSNARTQRKIEHFLHRWGYVSFVATVAVLFGYLVLWLLDKLVGTAHAADAAHHGGGALNHALHTWIKATVTVTAAGLPALGAAFAGIEAQGGFGDRAERSAVTAEQLAVIRDEIEEILAAPEEPVSLERAHAIVLGAARIMLDDVQSWRQTYAGKGLSLPA